MVTTPPLLAGTQRTLEVGNQGQPYWMAPTLTRCANGDLLAVYYGAGSHVGPAGNLYSRRSTDHGDTWGPRATVVDDAFDNRDPGLTTLRDGRVLLSYSETDNTSYTGNGTFYRARVMVSSDHGATWDASVTVPPGVGLAWSFTTAPVVETPRADELLLPYYGSAVLNGGSDECRLAVSTDGGASWADRAVIAAEPGKHLDEPVVVLLADRVTLVCFVRNSTDNRIEVCRSTDWGVSWSARQVVTAGNGRPAAAVASDGLVLVQFRDGETNRSHYLALDATADPASAGAEVNLASGSTAVMVYGGWAQRASDGRLCAVFAIENSANVYFQVVDTGMPILLMVPPAADTPPPPPPPPPPDGGLTLIEAWTLANDPTFQDRVAVALMRVGLAAGQLADPASADRFALAVAAQADTTDLDDAALVAAVTELWTLPGRLTNG